MRELAIIDFFGLKLNSFDIGELKAFLGYRLEKKITTICFGYSLGTFPYLKKHPEIAEYSNSFELMVCDGRGLYTLAKLLGFPVKSDISIPNLTWLALEIADTLGYTVLIVGSSPNNNEMASLRAQEKYPGATFYPGNDGGDFSLKEQEKLVGYINLFNPDILLIGVSSPKKEYFAYHYRDKINASLIIPFGGAIDILSGKSKPIPKLVKRLMLGFIWRWLQEPRRLFRDSILYTSNVLFILIPSLVYNNYIKKRGFSIIEFYKNK